MPPRKFMKKNKSDPTVSRALIEKEEGTEYAQVIKALGNGRFTVQLNLQTKQIIARVRGKFKHGAKKKANFVNVGGVVLVSLRDFQDDIADIIHIYDNSEINKLRKAEEIIFDAKDESELDLNREDDDCGFDFSEI